MKKGATVLIAAAVGIVMTACGNRGQTTYYPGQSEMISNLEDNGYEIEMQTTSKNGYSGIYLEAERGDDFIDFYWLDDGSSVSSLEADLKEKHTDYAKLYGLEDDSKYGSLAFCSSDKAMTDAGIRIEEEKKN